MGVSWPSQGQGTWDPREGFPVGLLQEEPQKEKKKASWGPTLSIQ